MNWILKLLTVSLCFSLCGAGSFIVSIPLQEKSQEKTKLMPVKNREITHCSWIQV